MLRRLDASQATDTGSVLLVRSDISQPVICSLVFRPCMYHKDDHRLRRAALCSGSHKPCHEGNPVLFSNGSLPNDM